MDKLPCINVSFMIEGKYIDFEQLNKYIDIFPTKTRGLEDWPRAIKNNLNLPQELQPRCEWSICRKTNLCKQIEIPINKIIEQLKGNEEKLIEFCEKNKLKKGLLIVIHGEAMNLPEIVLSSTIVSYFGKLGVEIGFDIYIRFNILPALPGDAPRRFYSITISRLFAISNFLKLRKVLAPHVQVRFQYEKCKGIEIDTP